MCVSEHFLAVGEKYEVISVCGVVVGLHKAVAVVCFSVVAYEMKESISCRVCIFDKIRMRRFMCLSVFA